MKLFNGIAILEGDSHISEWIKHHKRLDFDQNMLPRLNRYLHKTSVVIDIGAFIGDTTEHFAKNCKEVYAFEPNPKAFECLEYNMKKYNNVVCINQAVGSGEGFEFIEEPKNKGASYLKKTEHGNSESKTLDSYNLAPDFIKIDAEGFEVDILKGAEKTILKHEPFMLIEVNEGALKRNGYLPENIFKILQQYNYICTNIYHNQPMTGLQFDIICHKQ